MQIDLKIDGMHCDNCARAVKNVLSMVDSVESVNVDLKSNSATIFAKEDVDKNALLEAVSSLDFSATIV